MRDVAKTLTAAVRTLKRVDPGLSDRDLLDRHAAGDPEAFAALVRRHGKAVLVACRQVLTDPADIDDAFQAAFLVLLKKAKAKAWQPSLGSWLYAVAHRVAVHARGTKARRTAREAEAARRTATARERVSPAPDLSWRDAVAVLHEELDRLPERYRRVLLLCYLDGQSRDEAAANLGVKPGAVKGCLERGRALLATRLTRRGVALSAGLLAVLTGSSKAAAGGPPAELIDLAVQACGHPTSAVAALAHGAFPMTTTLKQVVFPFALVLGLIGVGVVGGSRPPAASADDKPTQEMKKPAAADAKGEAKQKAEVINRTITGTVVGPDGKPVQADLFLLWEQGKPESLGKSKADGTFKVTVPLKDPGAYLVAKADGCGIDFMMPATNTPADMTFKLPKDNPIRGRVIDTQGKPVAGATVTPQFLLEFGGSVDGFLGEWKTRHPMSGVPGGTKSLWFDRRTQFTLPDGRLLLGAITDTDGRFEIAGVGAERVVNLFVRGDGVADAEAYVVNRANFDPNPVNLAASDTAERIMPKSMFGHGTEGKLNGPTPAVVVEQEKPIRGVVTDRDTGKPRAGVEVSFGRVSGMELLPHYHTAKTDADGKFELRGSRKHPTYVLETQGDPDTGYLPCQVTARDTVGYEPIVADIGCAKGVVLSGKMTDKGTGKPLAGQVFAVPVHDNEFVKKYPTMNNSASGMTRQNFGGEDGTFRIVTVPGRVLLMAGTSRYDTMFHYLPPKADPKFPQYFHTEFGGLGYFTGGGGRSIVQGSWCKVVEIPEGEARATQDIELEPASRTAVRIADADGKPLAGCETAGLGWREWASPSVQETGIATAYGIEPKEERLIAAGHKGRKLVGAAVVKADDKEPVITLGTGGTVTGRVVDESGNPVGGVIVKLHFEKRPVSEVFERMTQAGQTVTDADGRFRFDAVTPGQPFRLTFSKGKKNFGPDYGKAARHTAEKHGETKDVGDQKIQALGE